ncbi:MAG: insulinase family protein [Sedimentisphaerales bacterium]|nr:insulinase family protein [Sedimentisphaerales bacterium]
MIKRLIIFLLVGLSCGLVFGQVDEGGDELWTAQEIRLVDRPGEIVAILPNGMTAIVRENHTAPVAAVRLHVRAGSIYEQEHLGAGMSHLFEHLLAGGETRDRSEEESRQLIEQIGARFNAYTSKAQTCYFLTVPAEHVGQALNLVAGWVTRPTFPQDAFEREWGVVQRELEMGASDPDRYLWKLFDEVRYHVHPGRYPVIGHQAIVQQLTREDILAYYDRMYVPDNCVVAVVGHINAEAMLEQIKREFSDFTRRGRSEAVLPIEPPITSPRRVVQVFEAMEGPAEMVIGFPSFSLQHEDLYALDTLANIMGGGRSSRLYRRLVEGEDQLALSVWAGNYTPDWAEGTFEIQCTVMPDKVEATETAVWEIINDIAENGVTEEELARAKQRLAGDHIRSHQTAEQQADTMARDYLATGDAHFSDHYIENMQEVTRDEVQEMARQYLRAERQITVVLTPVALPRAAEEAAAQTSDSPIRRIVLENGLRVLLRRNTSVPLVNMQFYVLGGLLDETDENNGLTNLMVHLSTRGTEDMNAQEIAQYFDSIGGALSAGCGNNTFFYTSEVLSGDFAEAFGVYSEVILSPTFPENELEMLREQILAGIAQISNSWGAAGDRYFREHFFTRSPYHRLRYGTAEAVGAIERDDILAFHSEHLVGSRAVLTIFGDIDLEATEALVRDTFQYMARGEAFDTQRFAVDLPNEEPRLFVSETPKEGAVLHVGFPGITLSNVEDRYALDVMQQIVGSNTGWLHEELRGRGLVYYAWGINFAGLVPGYFAVTSQCEADQVSQVISVIQENLNRAARGEFTEAEVARAKSQLVNSEVLDKQTNADMATSAALDELYGFGYDWGEHNADRIMAVTLADVQRVANQYLNSVPATITILTSDPDALQEDVE